MGSEDRPGALLSCHSNVRIQNWSERGLHTGLPRHHSCVAHFGLTLIGVRYTAQPCAVTLVAAACGRCPSSKRRAGRPLIRAATSAKLVSSQTLPDKGRWPQPKLRNGRACRISLCASLSRRHRPSVQQHITPFTRKSLIEAPKAHKKPSTPLFVALHWHHPLSLGAEPEPF